MSSACASLWLRVGSPKMDSQKRRRKLPSFDVRRINMIIPSTPTIPSHQDRNSRPEPALNDGIYLVDSPLHASRNISHPAPTRIRWMFIKLAWSQDPGDAGQFSSKRILSELVRGELVPPANTAQIL